MKKAVFILPYFGKFPNYFQLYLNSCGKNIDYDWIIFTDDKTGYNYPENIIVKYISFEDFVKDIKSKFNFNITLNFPKKLCDFKPLYGYIFSSLIKEYPYWGYCDCDLIFGDLNKFINSSELSDYSKIGICGHLTLMKNTKEINEFFLNNEKFFQVFSTDEIMNYDEGFDESVNNILQNMGKKVYNLSGIADISVDHSSFVLVNYDFKSNKYITEKKVKNFFIWDKGKLYRYIFLNKNINKQEFIYIHLQKRSMKVCNTNFDTYKIIPNSFDDVEESYFKEEFEHIKLRHITFHKLKFIYGKIRNKLTNTWK